MSITGLSQNCMAGCHEAAPVASKTATPHFTNGSARCQNAALPARDGHMIRNEAP